MGITEILHNLEITASVVIVIWMAIRPTREIFAIILQENA